MPSYLALVTETSTPSVDALIGVWPSWVRTFGANRAIILTAISDRRHDNVVKASQTEIAHWTGLTRSVITRELGYLERRGLIASWSPSVGVAKTYAVNDDDINEAVAAVVHPTGTERASR